MSTEEKKYWNPRIEKMEIGELKELQFRKLQWIFRYAYHNTPLFSQKYKQAGITPEDIKSLKDFEEVPTFLKEEIRKYRQSTGDPFGGLLSVPMESVRVVHTSTGTTGVPTFITNTKEEFEDGIEAMCRMLYLAGVRPGDKWLCFNAAWLYSVSVMASACKRIGMVTLIDFGHPLVAARWFHNIKYFKPNIAGMPLDLFLSLLAECRNRGVDPKEIFSCFNRGIACAGEVLTSRARSHLVEESGVGDIFDAYAINDPRVMFIECNEHKGIHCWMDLWLMETIDIETGERLKSGERGSLIVTNLWARGTPYVRFDTEDYGSLDEGTCDCGRSHVRLMPYGRSAFLVNVKGKKIVPIDIQKIMERHKETADATFTIIKDGPEPLSKLKLKAVFDAEKTKNPEELKGRLESEIENEIGVPVEIQWVPREEIPVQFWKIIRVTDLTKQS